jgi:S1-C subfamily serine protease
VRRVRLVAIIALLAWPALACPTRTLAEEPAPTPAEALITAVAPAIVEIRFTASVTFSMMGQSGVHSDSGQTAGTMIDSSGLVLTSDSNTGGVQSPVVATIRRMIPDIELKVELEELRVLLSDGADELPAVLVARDSRNDLAWVQIVDVGERKLATVDLGKGRDPRVGERVASIARLGRGFDYAPYIAKGRVTSVNELPRRHWNLASDAEEPGLLQFALTGEPVGLLSYLAAAEGTDAELPEARLLSIDVVRKSRETARARVAAALAEARAAKDTPKEPEAPKEPAEHPPKEPEKR